MMAANMNGVFPSGTLDTFKSTELSSCIVGVVASMR